MDTLQSFPFKIGEDAESKSHMDGYRGAWFRCKVKNMKMRGGELWCALEYYDYPAEKVRWTKAYQKDPADKNKVQLMMRPRFPHFYHECDLLDDQNSETVAIINNEWEVGNLVDVWYDSCFWSGKIAAILDNNRVKVDLLKPPVGEGGSYDVDCEDLRPTLLWSIKSGWSVPLCKNRKNFKPCVRFISSLKGEPGPFLHMNSPAQDAHSPWKRLLPQDSESVAKMLPESRKDQGRDNKFHSHPDFENHMYTQTAKGISFGIGNLSSTCNLTELTQLLDEINGSKQFISDGQQNLTHGKSKCDLAVTTHCKDLPQNASGQSWQERRDESHEVGTSYICHSPDVPKQDWHVMRSTLDTDALQCQRKASNVQNSFLDTARTDSYPSTMNDLSSEKGRNVLALSTYKKEQARVIVERAKSFRHGRGWLRQKNPAGEDRCLVSLDSQYVMPSNKNEPALSVLSNKMSRNKDLREISCMEIDEIESSVVTLEELANKVGWLRGVMQFGCKQWSAVTETTWQFSEYQAPAKEEGGTGI